MIEFMVFNLLIWMVASILYVLLTWISVMIQAARITGHLRRHDYRQWEYITSFAGQPGGSNPFRALPYLYSDSETDAPEIAECKRKIRKDIRNAVRGLIVIGCIMAAFVVIAVVRK
jgi:hypothetical protein